MDGLFLKHKPRLLDFVFLQSPGLVRDLLVVLRTLPRDPIKSMTVFFRKYPFTFTYMYVYLQLQRVPLEIDMTDSIFIHTLLHPTPPPPISSHLDTVIPKVVGIIPDGNRRWASHSQMTPAMGHFFGAYKIVNMIRWSIVDPRVSHLVVYLMSYDNFQKRSPEEQDAIRDILKSWVAEFELLNSTHRADIAIIGEPDALFREAVGGLPINPSTRRNGLTRISLLVCYEGKREILQAGGDPNHMWLKEDIDIVIRTGYTQRSSGFCPFQTTYSEWFYPGMYWPEFTTDTFHNLLEESSKITQNFGK